MDPLMFPAVPADLSALSADELNELLAEHKRIAAAVVLGSRTDATAEQREMFGTRSAEEIVNEFTSATVEIKRIESAITELSAGAEAFASAVAEKAAEIGVTAEAEAEDDDDAAAEVVAEAEAEVVAEAEAIVEEAAAEAVVAAVVEPEVKEPVKLRLPSPSKAHQPTVQEAQGVALVASAGIEGIDAGIRLNRLDLAKAIQKARGQFTSAPAGFSEKAIVASADITLPEDRQLHNDNPWADYEKIQAVVGRDAMGVTPDGGEALIASGGLCAPVSNYYDLANISSARRPVRDALTAFTATRGGINSAAPPTLADVTTGVGYKTAAEDAVGGTTATKTCQVVACPDFSEVDVNMVYHCLQFGNLQSRTFPEQVAQFTDLTMAAHARLAEGILLTNIGLASTAVTSAAVNGAVNSLFGTILSLAAGMRSRHRTIEGLTLRALFPEWMKDLLVLDLIRQQFDRFERNQNGVTALLRSVGIEPAFYADSATGKSQVFGAQGAGAGLEFPTTAVWYLYPEGSFLFLDGGTLELGIVRDSTLNSTNDYTVFGETFENVAFIGVESLEVTSTLCPNGAVALPGTADTCA